jgi:protocatechuate 3,4-dioxygenase beta subunit
MDHDDAPIGRMLSRREVVALFASAGATVLVGCGPAASPAPTQVAQAPTDLPTAAAPTATQLAAPTVVPATNVPEPTSLPATSVPATAPTTAAEVVVVPACVIRPETTEGPFYPEQSMVRADIRSDPATGVLRDGVPLTLTIQVSQISNGTCSVLPNALVDIWHCDAAGVYSDVEDGRVSTVGQKWLRGAQLTDANGRVTFTTIYPGWYRGRAVHIHYKVYPTSSTVFTSQLFFDDTLTDQVLRQPPYTAGSQQRTLNSTDGIYDSSMLMLVTPTDQGYAATFDVGVQL